MIDDIDYYGYIYFHESTYSQNGGLISMFFIGINLGLFFISIFILRGIRSFTKRDLLRTLMLIIWFLWSFIMIESDGWINVNEVQAAWYTFIILELYFLRKNYLDLKKITPDKK